MAFNFSKEAQRETVISEVMEGREKLSVSDVIKNFPKEFTVVDFDLATIRDADKGEDTVFPVLALKECVTIDGKEKPVCFFGGAIWGKIVARWVGCFQGDIEAARAEFSKSEGVRAKMEFGRTKDNKNITKVTIL